MEDHSVYREEIEIIPHGDHPMSYDHTEPKYKGIGIFMAVTTVGLMIIGIAIQGYYELVYNNLEYQRVLAPENWTLRDLRNTEQWELTQYGYVDKTKGVVRMPIDQAMQLTAQDAAANKFAYPTAPYRVKTPEELAGQVPAVSQPGAAQAEATQNVGQTSSPHVQPQTPKQ
jgi:hypothetical protein